MPAHIKLDLADRHGRIEVDATDVSDGVRGIRLEGIAGETPRLLLDVPVHVTKVDGEATVLIPDPTHVALEALGWTPPGGLNAAYRERARLVAHIAALYPAVMGPAVDVDEPGWLIAYIDTPAGQMSWHIGPDDCDLFAHVEHVGSDDPRAQWDGHSTGEKYERLAALTRPDVPLKTDDHATVTINIAPDPAHIAEAIRRLRKGY